MNHLVPGPQGAKTRKKSPRGFAPCCADGRRRRAKAEWQEVNGKWFVEICRLPFVIGHLKFSFLVGLLIASLILPACRTQRMVMTNDPLLKAYDTEPDWNDPQHTLPLDYQQAQGKRVFYRNCVWCHADATPAGPSNRSNLNPNNPPLFNDGTTLNELSDEFMQNIITLGGSALGKSAMMPPWGQTLAPNEVRAVIAYARAIAQPPYKPPARPGSQYSVK